MPCKTCMRFVDEMAEASGQLSAACEILVTMAGRDDPKYVDALLSVRELRVKCASIRADLEAHRATDHENC